MEPDKSAIEHAFDLASSGRFHTIQEIRGRLRHEGYSEDQLLGPALLKNLRALINEARGHATSKQTGVVKARQT